MSDHDPAPDPIDKAYAQAESILHDEAARAARRARVLAAVAREPTPAPAAPAARRRSAWGFGGWLAAACVAGLAVFLVARLYEPLLRRPQTAPAASTSASATAPARPPAAQSLAVAPKPPTSAPSEATSGRAAVAAPQAETPAPAAAQRDMTAPAPPPPASAIAPERQALPEAPAAPPATAGGMNEERTAAVPAANAPRAFPGAARDQAVDATTARQAAGPTFSARAAAPLGKTESSVGAQPDQAARLRAAAAAGRTAEIAALLDQGVPVDAHDADGNTALIESVQADHPAAAALLRRRGANLDRKNDAGESARDLAAAKGDPALNQALGVGP